MFFILSELNITYFYPTLFCYHIQIQNYTCLLTERERKKKLMTESIFLGVLRA